MTKIYILVNIINIKKDFDIVKIKKNITKIKGSINTILKKINILKLLK